MPIFLKVNHQLESRTQEIWQSGSEGGGASALPTPILAQALAWVFRFIARGPEADFFGRVLICLWYKRSPLRANCHRHK